ncbi:class A beta-lactamase [Sphingomonas bacterium]|uniref:class A beta-lactamase n=1 Tax=Sphingomonas bacterium TaxID=1895847 RepID=UPI001575C6A6|nr:class A beta-lactamase [Sphingomonas bacterium]
MLTRRDTLLATGALCLTGLAPVEPDLTAIRATLRGGRLGVAALDTATGRRLELDAHARYAHCSVFKLPLVAAVLARVDRGRLALTQPVRFTDADLPPNAPTVRAHLAEGALPVAALCEAAITLSDNAAANLLLPLVGGPAGLTRAVRGWGDAVAQFDRNEPGLNTNLPGDPRDTTTPAAMLRLVVALTTGTVLSAASRALLIGWLEGCRTGGKRLRAGFPAAWRAGDKTGTGEHGAANDVAVAWPMPGRRPIIVASLVDAPAVDDAARDAAHAAIGRAVAAWIG